MVILAAAYTPQHDQEGQELLTAFTTADSKDDEAGLQVKGPEQVPDARAGCSFGADEDSSGRLTPHEVAEGWTAAGVLVAEKQFRRVMGYKDLPKLSRR